MSNYSRELFIREIETTVQKAWEEAKAFEYDAAEEPKYLAAFLLSLSEIPSLSQVFAASKADFAVGYQRLKGKHALCPFFLLCSGGNIVKARNLKVELDTYGCPPQFPEDAPDPNAKKDYIPIHPRRRLKSFSRQWNVLKQLGIKEEEIPKFTDPEYWTSYFALSYTTTMKKLGLSVDWRRAFINTRHNLYYNSFVNWQLTKLYELGKIKHVNRFVVWSPMLNSPCNHQDRAMGEGVDPIEYSLILLEVVRPFPYPLRNLEQFKVYLVAPTASVHTLYGQTNCWVHPKGDYVAVRAKDDSVFICTERAAYNMSFQQLLKEHGKIEILLRLSGRELIGTRVNAPLSVYGEVYVLPSLIVMLELGTGIGISVPAHSPACYAALRDIQKRQSFLAEFDIDPKWAAFELVNVINLPRIGEFPAVYACKRYNINSQLDRMDNAEHMLLVDAYHARGTMAIGEYIGKPPYEAKIDIKKQLTKNGEALSYAETSRRVVSRAGDECVVACIDDWVIDQSEVEWKKQTLEHVRTMETFEGHFTNLYIEGAVDWRQQITCSESNGIGSSIPWDQKYSVDPVTDSALFTAFSTVAHLLPCNLLSDAKLGTAIISPDQLTHEVWEYICKNGPFPEKTRIPRDFLEKLRKEFLYWYPVDVYFTNKEMVHDFVTTYLYMHCSLFPPEHLPKSIRTYGKLLWQVERCNKSVSEVLEKYPADAVRLVLACAGDTMDDGNFAPEIADSAILRFSAQISWVEEILASLDKLQTGPLTSFAEKIFESSMNKLIHETEHFYDLTLFRQAANSGFFEFQNARDHYRKRAGNKYHKDLILKFIEVQAILILPICPHFTEHLWKLLKKEGLAVRNARWPCAGAVDAQVLAQDAYIERVCTALQKRKNASKAKKIASATIYVGVEFPPWYRKTVEFLRSAYDKESQKFISDDKIVQYFKQQPDTVRLMDKIMPLVAELKKEVTAKGPEALTLETAFDEKSLLESQLSYIQNFVEIENIEVMMQDDLQTTTAYPGNPAFVFVAK